MAGRAVVLTTHSMVEADFLCDRIGIMVQAAQVLGHAGSFEAALRVGSEELVVKIEDDALEGVSKSVKERFGATAAADAGTLTYELSEVVREVRGSTSSMRSRLLTRVHDNL